MANTNGYSGNAPKLTKAEKRRAKKDAKNKRLEIAAAADKSPQQNSAEKFASLSSESRDAPGNVSNLQAIAPAPPAASTAAPNTPAATPSVSDVAPVATVASKLSNIGQTENNNNELSASSEVPIKETKQNETRVTTVNTEVVADNDKVSNSDQPLGSEKSFVKIGSISVSSPSVEAAVQNSAPFGASAKIIEKAQTESGESADSVPSASCAPAPVSVSKASEVASTTITSAQTLQTSNEIHFLGAASSVAPKQNADAKTNPSTAVTTEISKDDSSQDKIKFSSDKVDGQHVSGKTDSDVTNGIFSGSSISSDSF
ncbi:unnamed protein product [[Candida] boidinii]|nr:unnamed protein product [[Candida] boidinii]